MVAGGKFGRLSYGMPPASNGDWAWLQQIAKSLKDADPDTGTGGQGMVVMSQGVLFRGQTEEEDGQNHKADAEYVIRRGFIEAIVALPGKLFYGNRVPGCLLLLNKAKPAERRDKILMIWASRHYQKGNPQNLLRPSDLMRILVPWRAFGDLATTQRLVPEHEEQLIREVKEQRDARLANIEDAYGPVLEPLPRLQAELATLDALDLKQQAVKETITPEHPYFHPLATLLAEVERIEGEITAAGRGEKAALKTQLVTPKAKFDVARKKLIDAIKAHHKQVARAVKDLGKLVGEGFDHPPLDTLVLAMLVSWKGTLQHYAGRLHREHATKTDVRIIDFADTGHPALLRMWDKRQRGYLAMGYRIDADDPTE